MSVGSKKGKPKKPVLIVQHAEHEHPAILLRALRTQAIPAKVTHPYLGEIFPEMSEYSGMISLGGPMSVNDEESVPWIKAECQLIRKCMKAQLPMVGICLGGQLLAKALGARVEKNPKAEIGWFPLQINLQGKADPILGAAGSSPTVYHWHSDTFNLPHGAELLAHSKTCDRQAFRLGNTAYGFQFHPEADHQLVHEWLVIEGVESEIDQARQIHGKLTVQDARTQKNHALKGEKASLKIASAIGSLFRNHLDPVSKSPDRIRFFKGLLLERKSLQIVFLDFSQRQTSIRGKITSVLTLMMGTYIIFQDTTDLMWPFRLEDILKVTVET